MTKNEIDKYFVSINLIGRITQIKYCRRIVANYHQGKNCHHASVGAVRSTADWKAAILMRVSIIYCLYIDAT